MTHIAYISVGSNVGDRIDNCCKGISEIEKNRNSFIISSSLFYLTSPTDYIYQNWFINVAVKIKTILNPRDLLKELISIQKMLGRSNDTFKFGPRKLDLDIIFYENQVISLSDLEIPHSRMHKRVFVLQPICDINPDFIHPIFKVSVRSILDNIADRSQKVIPTANLIPNTDFK